MRLDAIQAFATRDSFTISECEELAKDLDAHDKMTFELVGPKGRKSCRWLDAHYGLFQMEGSDSAFSTAQFRYVADLRCENLNPNPPASAIEARRAATAETGAVHESAAPKADAQGHTP